MSDLTPEFKHIYSLTPEWRQKFVDEFDAKIVDNNMSFPSETASGSSFFMEILPEISVDIIDLVLNRPIRFTRMPSDEDFWIVTPLTIAIPIQILGYIFDTSLLIENILGLSNCLNEYF